MSPKCPGQDQRYWKPEDIFDVRCPYCGREIEFWKDEPFRLCRSCGREVRNPRIDLGCAEWCAEADACLGRNVEQGRVAEPVVERLAAVLDQALCDEPERLVRARAVCGQIDTLLQSEKADPRLAKPAALLAGAAVTPELCVAGDRSSAGDERLLDSEFVRGLLAQAGIGEEEVAVIEQIVGAVFSSRPPESAESMLVADAVQLVLHRCAPPAGADAATASVFHTQTAKAMARRP
jgi:ribosomal protein S14